MASRDSPQRVALAIESSGPGGAEQVVLHLARGLRARGVDVVVTTLRPGWLTERAAAEGVPVWLEPQAPGADPRWIARFARRLRRERVELVHSHEFAMNAYAGAAARLAGIPSWATLHGRHWIAGRRVRALAYRVLHGLGMGVVAVADDLAAFLAARSGLPRAAIEVVENGIALPEELTPAARAAVRARQRAALGLPAAAPLALAVGNLYPVKDHATLVRALAGLPDLHVVIAGRGEERERLLALARELGVRARLHLLGLRDDVAAWLEAADLFVHPSRSEAMPLAVLEAMAAGRAVVATRVGGIPEAVVDGESGRLVPPGDAAALGAAIASLMSDDVGRRRLGRAARARVAARFGVERMLERYLALYCSHPSAVPRAAGARAAR